jgi:hypothetical protein
MVCSQKASISSVDTGRRYWSRNTTWARSRGGVCRVRQ